MKTVTHKTCCELQEYVWIDGALVSVADLADVQREEMAERSARLKTLHTLFPGEHEVMAMLRLLVMAQPPMAGSPYHSQL